MRNLGLLPKRNEEDHHGFSSDELNANFAGVSVSPHENIEEAMNFLLNKLALTM